MAVPEQGPQTLQQQSDGQKENPNSKTAAKGHQMLRSKTGLTGETDHQEEDGGPKCKEGNIVIEVTGEDFSDHSWESEADERSTASSKKVGDWSAVCRQAEVPGRQDLADEGKSASASARSAEASKEL